MKIIFSTSSTLKKPIFHHLGFHKPGIYDISYICDYICYGNEKMFTCFASYMLLIFGFELGKNIMSTYVKFHFPLRLYVDCPQCGDEICILQSDDISAQALVRASYTESSTFRKLFWILVFFIATGYMCYGFNDIIQAYMSGPTTTATQVEYLDALYVSLPLLLFQNLILIRYQWAI